MEKEPKSPRERAGDLISLLVSDWRPSTWQVLWAIRIAIVLGLLVAIGYAYDITVWDWLKLLIVPAVIAGGGLWFNQQQQERQREDDRRQQKHGLEIERQRAQDQALEAYLDQMSQLLIDGDLYSKQPGYVSKNLARARTLTVLQRLDGRRKRSVLQFLTEARLIEENHTLVGLAGANLRGARLSNAALNGTTLSRANLAGADLRNANLSDTNLSGTNLEKAHLGGATVEQKQLQQASSLKGAIMPNGQKYDDWLEEKEGHKEDGESSAP